MQSYENVLAILKIMQTLQNNKYRTNEAILKKLWRTSLCKKR